jgi:hypothetical protein
VLFDRRPEESSAKKVVARSDKSLFTAFCLLNLVGYNAENGWRYGEVREKVRLKLATLAGSWQARLKGEGLLDWVLQAGGAQIMDLIPFLSLDDDSPLLGEEIPHFVTWQNQSKAKLSKIRDLLRRFFAEAEIQAIWESYRPAFDNAAVSLMENEPRLRSINSRFAEHENSFEVVMLPNLLDARGRGYSVSTAPASVLFFGPADDSREIEKLVVHEFLHRWVDPIAETLKVEKTIPDLMTRARAKFPVIAEGYPELSIWIGETVVRAATEWLLPPGLPNARFRNNEDLRRFFEDTGFRGFERAHIFFTRSDAVPLEEVLSEAVRLVGGAVSKWRETIRD